MSAFRQFTLSKGKSAGRNSAGRITIFHRGGGAKRLQRIVDLKRTNSSTGVVESIEYDPNRSSRIALVRWTQGVRLGPRRKFKKLEEFNSPEKFLEPITAAIRTPFSFSSLPGTVYQKKMMSNGTSPKDVFLSAFSSSNAKGETASLSLGTFGFPRIAVAGAKPAFFVPRMKEEVGGQNSFSLSEIQQSKSDSILWAHRIKRKAAVSWQSLGQQKSLGFGKASDHNKLKQKDRTCKVNHVPAV